MTRPVILIGESALNPEAEEILARAGELAPFSRFFDELPRADALLVALEVRLPAEVLERAVKLRVIATRTSQLRHIDIAEAERRGIAVLSIEADAPPLRETPSTAEEAFALLLALVRNVPWAFDAVKGGHFERTRYGGRELRGKTLGLVGFGRLGRMMCGYGTAFGMKVLAHDPYVSDEIVTADGAMPVSLDRLLAESDFVSLHCTWSTETLGLIGEHELGLMRPGTLLINTARGEITDEAAVLRALETAHLGGAAIDTLAGETPDGSHLVNNALVEYARTHENLIVLPHLGGATAEATARTQLYICKRLAEWLAEHP